MTDRKKIAVLLSVLFSIFLFWYLLIKKSDYCISFKVNTATGTVFQGVQDWSALRLANQKENYTTLEKRNFDFIKQEMEKENMRMEYTWDMKSINDSVTSVSVGIKDFNNSIYNRITAPFFSTEFKLDQIQKITEFKNGVNDHIKFFKVKIDGEGSSEETFVAYIKLKSVLQEKAQTMIMNDNIITEFIETNKIKIVGTPYLEIESWNLDKETVNFNYCFPIAKNTKFIPNEKVKFKTIPAIKGLKASYFGNFRTSDRAWFALLDYAKKHDYKLENKPLEHFLANPFNGGNELEWETQIIIPFASK
ncbi:effector-binding domain-containing protein [Flavobacterium sp. CG_9.10]|uniref:GyrI-like domain-containing protein n=1 Tax=Flavobacterium sp. CG_9.10 TaxID=2787729 RepID=UPI0018CB7A0E|nr:GyrI-like domain-containing protein [Flavobacterium sp. CG_9.10]MBG6110506.1 effector-binding domain-containing protein [Flavobacterium sp. CG_9.10]